MLNGEDLEQKIIDAVYRGACEPEELSRAIELLAQYFDSSGAILGEFDQAAPEAQFSIGVRTVDRAFMEDYKPFAAIDPAPRLFSALATGTATTTDRLLSKEELRRNVFLNEFLRPHGVDATLGGSLLAADGKFALVAVHQSTNRKPFGDDEIARFERLMPHFTRALQIRRLFLQKETRLHLLESMVGHNRTAMIGRSGASAFVVNEAARAIAAARDGITLDRDGRLLVADKPSAKRLAALEADVARGGAGGLVRIERPSGRPSYVVLVSPLPPSDDLSGTTRNGVLMAIHEPARQMAAAAQSIAHLLHIPLGAAKVVEAVLEGIELKDYADRAGISMNTVKFHLKTAFARTGTRSQAELVRNALLALSDLGPYFPNN